MNFRPVCALFVATLFAPASLQASIPEDALARVADAYADSDAVFCDGSINGKLLRTAQGEYGQISTWLYSFHMEGFCKGNNCTQFIVVMTLASDADGGETAAVEGVFPFDFKGMLLDREYLDVADAVYEDGIIRLRSPSEKVELLLECSHGGWWNIRSLTY
ncbi:MAG: hypothetical protein JW942_07780 [Opitutales bacterium]|nr:hypothetical protein [Opitutales bacterium]